MLTSAQFINVGCRTGEEKISLDALIPVASEDAQKDPNYYGLDYMINIQLLDNGGYTSDETTYEWYDGCWNNQGAKVTGVTFDAGQGLWVYNFSGFDVKFQSSGEVQQSDINYPLDLMYGAVGIVNAYPTVANLKDITPIAAPETLVDPNFYGLDYMVNIQLLDNGGYTSDETTYEWYNDCWNNQGVPCGESVQFNPGDGLWVYNYTGLDVSLHVPAPEL